MMPKLLTVLCLSVLMTLATGCDRWTEPPAAAATPAPAPAPAPEAAKPTPAPAPAPAPAKDAADKLPTVGVLNTAANDAAGNLSCVKVDKGPAVDGNLDDEAWKKAVQVNLGSDKDESDNIPENQSAALVCHDADNFYIGIVCMEKEMGKLQVKRKQGDKDVYADDCVELYFDAALGRNRAVKLIVNADGAYATCLRTVDGESNDDVTWSPAIKTARLGDRFVLEIAVPLRDLGAKGKAGAKIGFNVYRQRQAEGGKKQTEYSTWHGGINKVDSLGTVTLE